MNSIAEYLPVLVLNFNLYGIACTVRTPAFCKKNLLDYAPLLDVHETP